MAHWAVFAAEAPELAALAERRITATMLVLLATLRRDGFPRISPVEPLLHQGRLRLGMMSGSTKALDLRREPRCALHTATVDKDVREGDVKLWGRGVEVTDEGVLAAYGDALEATTGYRPRPGRFHLFDIDLEGVSSVRVHDGGLSITTWHPATPVRVTVRRE